MMCAPCAPHVCQAWHRWLSALQLDVLKLAGGVAEWVLRFSGDHRLTNPSLRTPPLLSQNPLPQQSPPPSPLPLQSSSSPLSAPSCHRPSPPPLSSPPTGLPLTSHDWDSIDIRGTDHCTLLLLLCQANLTSQEWDSINYLWDWPFVTFVRHETTKHH